jgi:serine protease
VREIGSRMHVLELEMDVAGEGASEALARLRADPAVEFVVPDARMRPHRVPSDPGYTEQWFLRPSAPGTNGSTVSSLDAETAWDVTTGAPSIVVAVIDTGVRFDHPDLGIVATGGKLLPGYDFVGLDSANSARTANDGDGWDPDASDPGDWISSSDRNLATFSDCPLDDSSWHGTRVAGLVGAHTDNGLGIASAGWQTLVLPVRVLGKCGGYTSDIIAGMRWAAGLAQANAPANPTPARILNLSLGGEGGCSAAYQAAIDEITARGVIVVVSAGNDGSTVDQPANCRGVVAVTGVRHVGTKVGFANLGADVTIAAPGGNCVNTAAGAPCLYSLDTTTDLGETQPAGPGYTDRLTRINVGTSFASPLVSGAAALMLSVNDRLPGPRLVSRMQASARPFPASPDPSVPACRVPANADDLQNSECNCSTATCGAGLLYAPGAVAEALRPVANLSGPSTASAGATVALSGAASTAANGRTIAGYAWSVPGGGVALAATSGPQTSFVAPGGPASVTVRLTVTDDLGAIDSVDQVITVGGVSPPPPPPPVDPPIPPPDIGNVRNGGGGGTFDAALVALALALLPGLLAGRRRRRRAAGTAVIPSARAGGPTSRWS